MGKCAADKEQDQFRIAATITGRLALEPIEPILRETFRFCGKKRGKIAISQ